MIRVQIADHIAVLTGKGKCFCAGVDIEARPGGLQGPLNALAAAL